MRWMILIASITCAACADDPKPAASGTEQAAQHACSGQPYDGCTSDDQCESQQCKLYSNRGVQVCTQTCSATNPCPTQNGQAVVCNNMGLCRPDAVNACELP